MINWKSICCAVDLTDPSSASFDRACELALHFGGRIAILHVSQLAGYTLPDGPAFATAETLNRHRVAQEAALSEFEREARRRGVHDVETVNQIGDPATEIVRFAELGGFDVIVVGTHGYSGLRHAFMGSVAEKVVRRARCPVLVVHPQDAGTQPAAH